MNGTPAARNVRADFEPRGPCGKQTRMQWRTHGSSALRPKSEPGDARLSRTPFAQLPGLAIAGTGIALLGLVVFANSAWFDRHFLPDFFMPRSRQLAIVTALRLMAVLFGLILVLIGRTCVRRGGEKRQLRRLASKTAIVAGVCVSSILTTELILRTRTWHAAQFHNSQEPRRIADPYLGWVFQPNHHGRKLVAGRRIDFAIDALGYRVGGPSQKVDYTLPAVIFSGESVMAGDGLQWRDAIPAQVGDRLHIQPVDIAVNGYSTDQSHMRLAAELPRFACPVAVVSIFMPSFLERNLNIDRPHLDRELRWHPARPGWRLAGLAQTVLHYRGEAEIQRGIATTRAVLVASQRLARSRGAIPLLIVPEFTPETPVESSLRKRVLDDGGLDYVAVPVDSRFRIPGEMHPDAHGAAIIAAAVTNKLEAAGLPAAVNSGNQGRRQCRRPDY